MDYEKEYYIALDKARLLHHNLVKYGVKIITKDIEDIFPELKESEDEKTWIINYLNNRKLNSSIIAEKENLKKAIAWLEKQGESYTKRDVDDAYLKGITNTKKEIEKQYEANYQIRKDIATFIFNYRGDIKDRAKWIDYLGIKVSFVEKQGEQKPVTDDKNAEKAAEEYRNYRMSCGIKDPVMLNEIEEAYYEGTISKQKPVEWSEEDLTAINCIIKTYDRLLRNSIKETDQHEIYRLTLVWLNELKSRVAPQPKQEWSEKDDLMATTVENSFYLHCGQMTDRLSEQYKKFFEKVKSLKPQKQWKPTEEHLQGMRRAICKADKGSDAERDLKDLYEQLKAL